MSNENPLQNAVVDYFNSDARPLKMVETDAPDEIDTQGTDDIVCPHCGNHHEYGPDWDYPGAYSVEDCQECGKQFKLETEWDPTFYTEKWEPKS